MSIFIDVIRGNMVFEKSAVVDCNTFSGDWEQLMTGAETPCEWGDDGEVTAYAVIHSDDEA